MTDDIDIEAPESALMDASRPWLAHLEFDGEDAGEALRAFLVGLHCDTYGKFPTRKDYTLIVDPAFQYIRSGECLREAGKE